MSSERIAPQSEVIRAIGSRSAWSGGTAARGSAKGVQSSERAVKGSVATEEGEETGTPAVVNERVKVGERGVAVACGGVPNSAADLWVSFEVFTAIFDMHL